MSRSSTLTSSVHSFVLLPILGSESNVLLFSLSEHFAEQKIPEIQKMTIENQTAGMEGNFVYVGLDIDTTGLRLIDEVSMLRLIVGESPF